jgi:hypothetical protein
MIFDLLVVRNACHPGLMMGTLLNLYVQNPQQTYLYLLRQSGKGSVCTAFRIQLFISMLIRKRIRIQEAKSLRIQADQDPDPDTDPDQTFNSQKVKILKEKYI